jgi:hypothetical protein
MSSAFCFKAQVIRIATGARQLLTFTFTGGGIQAAGTLEALHTGEKLIIAGLFTQLFFFALFVVVAGVFHYRLVNDKPLDKRIGSSQNIHHRQISSTSSSSPFTSPHELLNNVPWKRHLYNLYITSGLIVVRSLFRVIEYLQGNAGYLLSHEVFLYIFDAALMLAAVLLFNWFHPSEVTEAYNRKQMDTANVEIQQLGQDAHRMV